MCPVENATKTKRYAGICKRFLKIMKVIISRLIFVLFSIISIGVVTLLYNDQFYWFLLFTLIPLLAELVYTIYHKKPKQFKWITPSVLFYLICSVPCIWLLELQLLEDRLNRKGNRTALLQDQNPNTSQNEIIQLLQKVEIPSSDVVTASGWTLALEQILIFAIIFAKWIAPQDGMSSDELSQLLLVNIASGADILELLETFNEEKIQGNAKIDRPIVYIIMSAFTWSLLQFIIALTAVKTLPAIEEVEVLNTPAFRLVADEVIRQKRETLNLDNSSSENNDENLNSGGQIVTSDSVQHLQRTSDPNDEVIDIEPAEINDQDTHSGDQTSSSGQSSNKKKHAVSFCIEEQSKSDDVIEALENEPNNQNEEVFDTQEDSQVSAVNSSTTNINSNVSVTLWRPISRLLKDGPWCFCFYNEIWGIALTLIFQDAPFFVIRVVTVAYYGIITHTSLFFTAKNAFVICLLSNRIVSIIRSNRKEWIEQMELARTQKQRRAQAQNDEFGIRFRYRFHRPSTSVWRSMVR